MSTNSPASLGVQAQWGFGAANPVTVPCELGPGGDALKATRSRVMTEGLRGTRQRIHETTGDGIISIAGDVELIPTYTPLAAMLPFIMGAAATGSGPSTYAFAEANANYGSGLQGFYATSDRRAKVFTYAGVNVSKAVFSCQQGQAMKCVLSLVAQTETVGASGTFPALTYPTDSPFMWSSASATFNAVGSRALKDWTLTIDNHPITDRFNNSQTATQFPFTDFTVTLEATMPFTADEVDLYGVALNADVSGSLALSDTDAATGPGSHAAHTLTFTFGKLDWASETPVVAGRGEIPTKVKFVSRKQTQGSSIDSLSISM